MTATCRGCAIVFTKRENEDNLVNGYCETCADLRRKKILAKRHKGN